MFVRPKDIFEVIGEVGEGMADPIQTVYTFDPRLPSEVAVREFEQTPVDFRN